MVNRIRKRKVPRDKMENDLFIKGEENERTLVTPAGFYCFFFFFRH